MTAVTADDERIPDDVLEAIPTFASALWHCEPPRPRTFSSEIERLVEEARRLEDTYNAHVAALERSLVEANAELDELRRKLAEMDALTRALDAAWASA